MHNEIEKKHLREIELLFAVGRRELTVIDSGIEAMNVTVVNKDLNERQKIGPLKSVFVEIFWWTVTSSHNNHSKRK